MRICSLAVFGGAMVLSLFSSQIVAQEIEVMYGQDGDFAHLEAPPNGKNYEWSMGDAGRVLKIKNPPLEPSTYTVRWYCLLCSKQRAANITLCTLSSDVSLSPESHTGAENGSIRVSASGGSLPYTYSWNNNSNSNEIRNLSEGIYSVTITDRHGCITKQERINVGVSGLRIHFFSLMVKTSCPGREDANNEAMISGGAPPYVVLLNGNPINYSDSAALKFQQLKPGDYQLQVIDSKNTSAVAIFKVSDPAALHASVMETPSSCYNANDGRIATHVEGGSPPYSIIWEDGVNSFDRTDLPVGQYTASISDKFGCTTFVQAVIEQPHPVDFSVSAADAVCFSSATGRAVVNIISPGEYEVQWSNGSIGSILEGVTAGGYDFRIFNDRHCMTGSVVISEPLKLGIHPKLPNFNGFSIACQGGRTESFRVHITGGVGPYVVAIYPEFLQKVRKSNTVADKKLQNKIETLYTDSVVTLKDLIAGTYCLDITDANHCKAALRFTLTEPQKLNIETDFMRQLTCYRDSSGYAHAFPSGGVPPYNFAWYFEKKPISAAQHIDQLQGGIYELIVADANGCVIAKRVSIAPRAKVVINFDKSGKPNPSGGVPPYQEIFRNETKFGYSLTIRDANGCPCSDTYLRPMKMPQNTAPPHNKKKRKRKSKNGECYKFTSLSGNLECKNFITQVS
ncbi:MAG: SprB repeat-containing protein [Saprospiraceae bacterium]